MSATRIHPLFRLMPSLTDIAFVLPLVFLYSKMDGSMALLSDGDTGWHIRAGDWILANGHVPQQDVFSFTKPGEPWFAWEWAWDVLFALLHRDWGLGGVVVGTLLILSFTYMLLFKLLQRRCGNPLVAILLTTMSAGGASLHWLARPHMVTLLFMVLFLWVLEGVRETLHAPGAERTTSNVAGQLWLLPILTVLWTNLHGGFFVGIILCGAYAGGELLSAVFASDSGTRRDAARNSIGYLGAAAGCLAASLVNPYTYHLHQHIYEYLQDPFLMQSVQEFQSTNFQWSSMFFFEIMLALGVASSIWYGMRKQFTEALLIVGWGHLALLVVRNVPIFMIAGPLVVARPICAWLAALSEAPIASWMRTVVRTVLEISEEILPLERPWRIHLISAAAMGVLALAIVSPAATGKLRPIYDPARYPEAALGTISAPNQRVFTHDEWGDYLIYRLSPQGGKVFVDGRSDFYGTKFDQAYIDVMNVKYGWEKTLARYGVNTILLPVDTPLTGALKESRRWKVIYDDHQSIVFETLSGSEEQVSTATNGGRRGRDVTVAPVLQAAREGQHYTHRE
ncbi:MAG: hypothetical protein ABL967_00025 [Bryobacteraceae bacterium]